MTPKPVFGLDLDGTLLDYHRHFITFANQHFGSYAEPEGYDSRLPLYRYLGVSKERYRQCKMAYRKGEMKRSCPLLPSPYPNGTDVVNTLRKWGAEVWFCTTRPYLAYDAIDASTPHNLRRHGMKYNGILWGQNKYRELAKTVGKERIVAVLDDVPEMCEQAEKVGLRTAFALRKHNAEQARVLNLADRWPMLKTYEETELAFYNWLKEWQHDRNG